MEKLTPRDGTLHADKAPKALTYTMTRSVNMTQNLVTGAERGRIRVWLVDVQETHGTRSTQTVRVLTC